MKKGLIFILIATIASSVFSQEGKEKKGYYENEAKDRLVLGFTFDNWIHSDSVLKTKWNSFGFHLAFMYDLPLGKSPISFAPGIGISASWVKNNVWLDDTTNTSFTVLRPVEFDYKRNSLMTVHFDVPIELRYRSKPNANNKSFKLAIGAVFGVLMGNHTRTKTNDVTVVGSRGDTKLYKEYKFSDIQRFKFGPTFRIGYGAINLYTFFNITKLFKSNEGPDVYPFSVGLTINGL